MFNPSRDDVRRFFCTAWEKFRGQGPLTPLEAIAADWIVEHPEYHHVLEDADCALGADFHVDSGQTNPFLHLSMHLSIEEQISIDQPRGIRDAFGHLTARYSSRHDAMHEVMQCLGEALWTAQRQNIPINEPAYLECILRKAGRVPKSP